MVGGSNPDIPSKREKAMINWLKELKKNIHRFYLIRSYNLWNDVKYNTPFHGGCHGCENTSLGITDDCLKCKYCGPRWDLVNMNTSAEPDEYTKNNWSSGSSISVVSSGCTPALDHFTVPYDNDYVYEENKKEEEKIEIIPIKAGVRYMDI